MSRSRPTSRTLAIACAPGRRPIAGRLLSHDCAVWALTRSETDQLIGEFTSVFTNADGNLFIETYNQLNAYFATVPGNYAQNLRKLYLLNTNYADLSFLFTILPGEKTNAHLGTEYLAVLETDNSTPYFLNLHNGEVAHTLILGMTGSGKTIFAIPAAERAEVRR
jgi:type IV secretory pathway VirB4 component